MSGRGAPASESVDGGGLRVGVAVTQWHPEVSAGLLDGAVRALADSGVVDPTVVRVPGAFELPIAARVLADEGHDAVVCLGAVIRGETPHFEYVARAAADGCQRVALDTAVPVGFGVLTCDTVEQALARCGGPGAREDKGAEAAQAAVATAVALRALRHRDAARAGFR